MKNGYYVRLKYPEKPKFHVCKTPHWFDRFMMDAKRGAIWHCDCGKEWIYKRDVFEAGGSGEYVNADGWVETNVQSNT